MGCNVLKELKNRSLVWVWCLHCGQVFHAKDVRVSVSYGEELYYCPYDDCSGNLFDFRLWKDLRSGKACDGVFVGRLPEVPEYGEVYPLYVRAKK